MITQPVAKADPVTITTLRYKLKELNERVTALHGQNDTVDAGFAELLEMIIAKGTQDSDRISDAWNILKSIK